MTAASPAQTSAVGLGFDVPVHREVLDNGLTLVLAPDPATPLAAVRLFYRVGSRDEHSGITGIAHVLEHAMFLGTERYGPGRFDEVLGLAGGAGDGFTNRDSTCFLTSVPPTSLDRVLTLEADRMVGLRFAPHLIRRELDVVRAERAQLLDGDPLSTARVALIAALFQSHPYRWPVLGWAGDVDRLDAATCREFYRRHYAPDRAVLAIAGDIDVDSVAAMVRARFGGLPRSDNPVAKIPAEPERRHRTRIELRGAVRQTTVWLGFRGPPASDDDHPVLDVIHEVLSRGPGARLYERLVRGSQVATRADLAHEDLLDAEPVYVEVDVREGHEPDRVEALARAELERLATELVEPELIERAVVSRSAFMMRYGFTTPEDRATVLGRAELVLGDARRALELPDRWRAVTPERLREVAARVFDFDAMTVVVLRPEDR